MGTLKGNAPDIPAIGFMAHVDTADDVCGNGVKARRFVYEGGDIALENGTVIRSAENPDLAGLIGHEIITSDGTTLLGADDKAGVSEIMESVKYLTEHPEIRHGDIEIYFTPDEETGSGMMKFPHDRLKSKCCYTLDGGRMGEVEAECFNAAPPFSLNLPPNPQIRFPRKTKMPQGTSLYLTAWQAPGFAPGQRLSPPAPLTLLHIEFIISQNLI